MLDLESVLHDQPDIQGDISPLRPGAVNVLVIVPCPAVTRLDLALTAFIETNNASGATPIHALPILDGNPQAIEAMMRRMQNEDDLPDVLVTPALGTILSRHFRETFLETGIYCGVNHPNGLEILPEAHAHAAERYNIGFLAFGSWSVVRDPTFNDTMPCPRSWSDLSDPRFYRQFSIQGFHGIASGIHLLALMNERLGPEGVSQFGRNVRNIWHFSGMIKKLGSGDPQRTPFNILPGAAAIQIPSSKKAAVLEFEEGPLLIPLMMFARKSRLKESRKLIDFFWGDACRNVLLNVDFHMPDRMDWSRNHVFPDWAMLAARDFREFSHQLNQVFNSGHRPDSSTPCRGCACPCSCQ